MRKIVKPVLLVVLGILVAFPLFSMTYYTMVRTSTPLFCATCHEIEYAYNTWKTSTHAKNPQGVVADCMDCHLPNPHNTFDFFYAKTYHGLKDVIIHFTMDTSKYDHEKNREVAYEDMTNDRCRKCHRNILNMPYQRGAMLAHRSVLYSEPENRQKCVDCHDKLVHFPQEGYQYDQAVRDSYN
jgi:cytochrome c-type protein NapC/trimethylamine-N-oxide reductase cytochrome c-type subunit TorC